MYNIQEVEEREFTHSSDTEIDRDEARCIGEHSPHRAWVLTGRDVWHANPFYTGPAAPHPEDDGYLDDDEPHAHAVGPEPMEDAPFSPYGPDEDWDDIPF